MRLRTILVFWLPLLLSWMLMTTEGPLISAAINRLPDAVVMLAALGIVFSLAVTLESPIINLLATATALVGDRPSYLQVRRFTVHWMVGLTTISALLAWTPLFELTVSRLMGVPDEVARWVRPGLAILVPWSAAIAWRRFLQGVLIHGGRTRPIAWGTAIRLAVSGGLAIGLAVGSDWSGIHLGATALVAGVVAEALYASLAARTVVRELPATSPAGAPTLTYRRLFAFHLPLAGTSVLTLLVQPLVTATLARLDRPTLTLAAWPIVFQALLFLRAPALALPEAVIALGKRPRTAAPLRRFSLGLAALMLVLVVGFAATPLVGVYLYGVQQLSPEVGRIARLGLLLSAPLPALAVALSWLRGVTIGRGATALVNEAMAVRVVITVAGLGLALAAELPGMATATLVVVVSVAAELAWLARRQRSLAPAPATVG